MKFKILNESQVNIHYGSFVDSTTFNDLDGDPYDLIPSDLSSFTSNGSDDDHQKGSDEPRDDEIIDIDNFNDTYNDYPSGYPKRSQSGSPGNSSNQGGDGDGDSDSQNQNSQSPEDDKSGNVYIDNTTNKEYIWDGENYIDYDEVLL